MSCVLPTTRMAAPSSSLTISPRSLRKIQRPSAWRKRNFVYICLALGLKIERTLELAAAISPGVLALPPRRRRLSLSARKADAVSADRRSPHRACSGIPVYRIPSTASDAPVEIISWLCAPLPLHSALQTRVSRFRVRVCAGARPSCKLCFDFSVATVSCPSNSTRFFQV